jgi:hypothetical protein
VLGRPLAIWILAVVAVFAGLSALIIALQFAGAIPWAGENVEFFYGKWGGVFVYGLSTFLLFAAAFGWLTLKPWAPMITLLFALFGFFIPLMSYFAGTHLFSAALAPMILSAVVAVLSFRPSVRRALAEAAAAPAKPKPKPAAAKPKAKVANPKGFRSDEV